MGSNTFSGEKEWVIGARQAAMEHQQQDGNRENVTVLMTICVDGTALPPTAIFKGRAFQMKWKQDNPADAARVLDIIHKSKYTHSVYSIAYLERGWTNGEMCQVDKFFDEKTHDGWHRLLLVDGHNSHYTWGFLEYAHAIKLLCSAIHHTPPIYCKAWMLLSLLS